MRLHRLRRFLGLAAVLCVSTPVFAQVPEKVFIDDLTWTEICDAIRNGKTTIILGTGGTEQNGPHMVMGKHNIIMSYTAEQIARALGNALVAPIVAYVPEGDLDPPTSHMRFPSPTENFWSMPPVASG